MNTASLTFSEAAELFYIAMETQDRFFEFWITATIAVDIPCHLGSKKSVNNGCLKIESLTKCKLCGFKPQGVPIFITIFFIKVRRLFLCYVLIFHLQDIHLMVLHQD